MTTKLKPIETLATPAVFRKWLQSALFDLKINPTNFSVKNGLGGNTVSHFLRTETADIRLGNAQRLHQSVMVEAERQGVDLPDLGAIING